MMNCPHWPAGALSGMEDVMEKTYTKEQLEAYLKMSDERLKNAASAWMKDEIRKGIELAKAELAKLEAK